MRKRLSGGSLGIIVPAVMATLVVGGTMIASGGAAAQTAAPASGPAAPVLKRADVDALLATPEKVLIVDVRRPDEIASKGGFPVYLDVQLAALDTSLPLIPRDRTIITVSNHAARATRAASLLRAHGFSVAGAIGVEGYAAEGGTLFKPAPPPASAATKPNP